MYEEEIDEQYEYWDKALKKHSESNFLQSQAWANANSQMGNFPFVINLENHDICVSFLKDAKRGRYLEIPGGPLIDWDDSDSAKKAFSKIIETAKRYKCVFVRFRPQLLDNAKNRRKMANLGAKIAPMHLAAEHTVIIDLSPSEDELLANMRRQTRYEVRRSIKLGITVEKDNSKEIFEEFHKVQAETASRQNFVPPSLNTLLAERNAFFDNAWIYKAMTEDKKPIAYGLILIDGDEAEYYEAASTELNRKLPGAYALQWQVMKDLKKRGVKRYNLWGIAPKNQPNHRYAGVTTFKTGFGGKIVEFVPAHDIIINPAKYALDFAIESVRKKRRHL